MGRSRCCLDVSLITYWPNLRKLLGYTTVDIKASRFGQKNPTANHQNLEILKKSSSLLLFTTTSTSRSERIVVVRNIISKFSYLMV